MPAMSCPACGCNHSLVTNTISNVFRGQTIVRRRRKCRHCLRVYFTREEHDAWDSVTDPPEPPEPEGNGTPKPPVPPKKGHTNDNPYL